MPADVQLRRDLYCLGYFSRAFCRNCHQFWFLANVEESPPPVLHVLAAELIRAITALGNRLDDRQAECVQALDGAARHLWDEVRREWNGQQHVDVIETIADARFAREEDQSEWCEATTILNHEAFEQFQQHVANLIQSLEEDHAVFLHAGELTHEVLTMSSFGEADPTEREYPVPALRAVLERIRELDNRLVSLEIALPGVDIETSRTWAWQCHCQILDRLLADYIVSETTARRCLDDLGATQPSGASQRTGPGSPSEEAIQTGNETSEPQSAPDDPGNVSRQEPSRRAIAAYRIHYLKDGTQSEIAAAIQSQFRTPCSQGQVSRWLKQVAAFIEAGNVLPSLLETPPTDTVDPNVIDMGQRQDGRTPRQRKRRDDDD
jgi:hypothetical protein